MNKISGKSGRIKIGSAVSITGATGTTTITVTATAHGLLAGQFVLISSVVGMTDLNNNGKGWLVDSVPSDDTFTVVPAVATSQTYTSGGSAQRIIPITEFNLTVNGEVGDANDSESGDWKERLVGKFKDWEFDYGGLYYDGQGMPPVNEELDVELDLDSSNYYSGSAIFDNFKFGPKVEGAQSIAITGTAKGNGELTLTNS